MWYEAVKKNTKIWFKWVITDVWAVKYTVKRHEEVDESELRSVISLWHTCTHTHTRNTVLPKVFVCGRHFLQQVGDIIGHVWHFNLKQTNDKKTEVKTSLQQQTASFRRSLKRGSNTRATGATRYWQSLDKNRLVMKKWFRLTAPSCGEVPFIYSFICLLYNFKLYILNFVRSCYGKLHL